MKLQYRDGLIFISIKINHHGKTIDLNNIVIDTGVSYCIIEPSTIEELGILITRNDEIETFYGVNSMFNYVKKTVDSIIIDDVEIRNVDIYAGSVAAGINGLLGLML